MLEILLIPVVIFLLPYFAVRSTEGARYSFWIFMAYLVAAISIFFLILIFDNGIDPKDGEMGMRILAPYFVLSVPVAVMAVGTAGWLRWQKFRIAER